MPPYSWRGLLPDSIKEWTGPTYHYTSPRGLLGVLENQELWATEASGMNDIAEVRQGWDFIHKWLAAHPENETTINTIRGFAKDDFSQSEIATTFMCCASTQRDDANQWRLYANSGRGYVVELDASVRLGVKGTADPADPAPTLPGQPTLGTLLRDSVAVSPWLKVLYEDSQKSRALDSFLANARTHRAKMDAETEEEWDLLSEDFRADLRVGLATIAQLMKSPGFAGENEVRTVVSFVTGDDHASYRETEYGIVRYARLISRPKRGREESVIYVDERPTELPVRSVGLGPLLSAQNNKTTVEKLLERTGHSYDVWESEVPLR